MEEKAQTEKEEAEKEEVEKEKAEKEKAEKEEAEKEKVEKEKVEKEKAEKEKAESLANISEVEKRSFTVTEAAWPQLQSGALDDVRLARSPIINFAQPVDPLGRLFIIEAIDLRLGLGLAANCHHQTKLFMSLEIAENGERAAQFKQDQRSLLNILQSNVRRQRAKFAGSLLVIDPEERGRGRQFWQKLDEGAASIAAFLAEYDLSIALLKIGFTKLISSTTSTGQAIPVVKAYSFPLIDSLCATKGLRAGDERLAQAKRLCEDNETAATLIDALSMEDDGEAFLDEIDNSIQDKEFRDKADSNVKAFFLSGEYGSGAAIFVASHLPDCSFSDFELMVDEIISAKAFIREKDALVCTVDDATLDVVGLRRGRMVDGNQRAKTVVRFQKGRRFPAVMKSRIEARAMIFSTKAFQRLGERLVAGAVSSDSAISLVQAAATHIAAHNDGDLDHVAKQVAVWLVGEDTSDTGAELAQRASVLVERTDRLFIVACEGIVRGLNVSQNDAAASLACAILALPETSIFSGAALLRMKARAAYSGLMSGAAPQRLMMVMHSLNAAPNLCKWLALALVSNNWGLAGVVGQPSLSSLDRVIQAGSQVLTQEPSPTLVDLASRLILRAMVARIYLDGIRTLDPLPPSIDGTMIACLLKLAAMDKPVAEPFLELARFV